MDIMDWSYIGKTNRDRHITPEPTISIADQLKACSGQTKHACLTRHFP
jgi:hypothetical protein